jgi:hypothetical protein
MSSSSSSMTTRSKSKALESKHDPSSTHEESDMDLSDTDSKDTDLSDTDSCSCLPSKLCPNHYSHQHQVLKLPGEPQAFIQEMRQGQVKAVQVTTTTNPNCCQWSGSCSLEFLDADENSRLLRVKDAQGYTFFLSFDTVISFNN